VRVLEGSPYQLGTTWDGRGTNFAIFSANAEKIELCLFDHGGKREIERIALPERSDDVWHGYLPEAQPGQVYGYRAYGPYDPANGHRFNPNKLLLDPYAKALVGPFLWGEAHYGYRTKSARGDLSFDRRDNARGMLKAAVIDPAFTWSDDVRIHRPWHETIIYEAHAKGLTKQRGDVPAAWRGTYRGLCANSTVAHLKKLGVTAIELLPIHAFLDEKYLADRNLVNYWGYNSIGFFAPEPRYSSGAYPLQEFKTTVRQLHDAGIEVILDVVYNHTAEGNELGPTLSFRGIDNASYYWLQQDNARYYENFTGTGNALNLTHPRVLQMVMDSLRYWVEQCHIDGFRFDLATTLGRFSDGFNPHAGFFAAIAQDPVLSRVKMIAEPWDIGLGGYQLGAFPHGWSEWNDKFRHAIRAYWRGDAHLIGEIAGRMSGSADLFRHRGRAPRASINHVTVHDGFTLADLTMYEHKHNEGNGEDNRDGSDDNQSANWGIEGPSDDAGIVDLRRRARRNMLACLFLAHGVPLLLAGDEVGNSQRGNNNAYCQDNEVGWVDWSALDRDGADDTAYIAQLVALRQKYPQLQPRHWLNGAQEGSNTPGILWLTPQAAEMTEHDWTFPDARFLSYVLAGTGEQAPLFLAMNAGGESVEFVFPEFLAFERWLEIFASVPVNNGEQAQFDVGATYRLPGHSLIVFEGQS
jgi:glycogen operon protein